MLPAQGLSGFCISAPQRLGTGMGPGEPSPRPGPARRVAPATEPRGTARARGRAAGSAHQGCCRGEALPQRQPRQTGSVPVGQAGRQLLSAAGPGSALPSAGRSCSKRGWRTEPGTGSLQPPSPGFQRCAEQEGDGRSQLVVTLPVPKRGNAPRGSPWLSITLCTTSSSPTM